MISPDPTRDAYNQIAAVYDEANQNRTIIAAEMDKFVAALPPAARVLDLGCGPGFDTAHLRQRGLRAYGLDLAWEMLRLGQAKYGVPLLQADLRHIPLHKVDGVWACASLLHLPPEEMPAALREIGRVLTPGGILYLSLKQGHKPIWQEEAYGQKAPRFFVFWTAETLDPLLIAAGFSIFAGWQQAGQQADWLVRLAHKDDRTSLA